METKKYEIQTAKSNIDWVGRKVTGMHHGTISIKEGFLILEGDQLTSGQVIINVTAIKVLDITDPATNAQFAGHLASCDFFDSEHYPEAAFNITSVSSSRITGNLTIKDKTHPVSFDASICHQADHLTASGKIIVDRTKYGMKFRSGHFFKDLGDRLIHNEFDLNVSITARKVF